MYLSVDPGKHYHGCALWENTELVAAWLTKKNSPSVADEITSYAPLEVIDGLAIEVPQIYKLRDSKGGLKGQNDLIDVALAAGELIGHLRHYGIVPVKIYRPREWKVQVPKDIMIERIKGRLSAEEKAHIDLPRAETRWHNVYDGIGVGLKFGRRL